MVATSGTVPYQYASPDYLFHFRIPLRKLGEIAPSAVLFEEAMYVLKEESNRLDEAGLVFPNDTLFVNGGFAFYLGNHASGFFDPNPSGLHLDGTNPTTVTIQNGGSYTSIGQPAAFDNKGYVGQMREVLHNIFDEISSKVGTYNHFDITEMWLQIYKRYPVQDSAAQGLFFLEDENDDFDLVQDAAMESGIFFDRYLNEVRYQPMPFLSGQTRSFDFETKDEMLLRPLKPLYWRTNGTLPPLWTSGEAWGDVLVDETVIIFSGGGSTGHLGLVDSTANTDNPWTPETNSRVPGSGTFSPKDGMTIGFYAVYIGNSGQGDVSGLFPWGTGSDPTPLAIHPKPTWPGRLMTNFLPSGGTQYGIVVDNNTTILQSNLDQAGVRESGLRWHRMIGEIGPPSVVDFYCVGGKDAPSGLRNLWGNEFYTKIIDGFKATNNLFRPGGYIYMRNTDKILRVANSGFSTLITNYPFGTGLILEWDPDLQASPTVSFPGTFVTPDSIVRAVQALESATDDETDLICNGHIVEPNNPVGVTSGCLFKLNRTAPFAPTDYIATNYIDGRVFWHRGQSEYLYLTTSGSSRRILEEMPNRNQPSGKYHTVALTWGDSSSPPGNMVYTGHVPEFSADVSGLWNLNGTAHARIKTVAFWNDEGTDDLFGMVLAFVNGAASGNDDVISRWFVKFDDTGGHPYTIVEAHNLGGDDTFNGFDFSMRNNVNWSWFADDFQY
jgi:hypothetical protein